MERASIILFFLAAMFYVAATVLYVYFFATKSRRMSILATVATGLGFISHTLFIILRWIQIGHPPISGAFDSLAVIAWWVALAYFLVEHLVRIKVLGVLMVPIAVFLLAWSGLSYQPGTPEIAEVVRSTRIWLHLAMVFTAYAAFTLAAGAAVLYLVQERQLKKKRLDSAFFKRLPPLHQVDELQYRAVVVGVLFATVGLMLGISQAVARAGTQGVPITWYDSPLVIVALIMWALYVIYLVLRRYSGWEGRRAAWLAIVGLAVISVLSYIARTGRGGFHIFGG
jgi:ABC-type transport system involved in cytochrome c biogenesis permease subunit